MHSKQILSLFDNEFHFIKNKFQLVHISEIKPTENIKNSNIEKPGVYIWVGSQGVVKVGKSQKNSYKRAIEHIRDNTSSSLFSMKSIIDDPRAQLILFNLKDPGDMHWLLSLEYFLEIHTNPLIPAARNG